ncbi:hypothetical protein SAICODRAFT_18514 [Saitoella complicata NRRL Y-17804]|uniref:uncharacterized protein n=1 Tax=Saitoella complicata (strain BCRC 22490 / CBS 7301 / JCM 7358 / NBRC 10748 / NRRL Y-17804) TaxID=698492 RepID=UPI0008676A6C|nr:uncharacterized protein SAICODRAFT_18514 [Saitoella complicata NRRL Y-17804]ODQ53950.1 hypothetical protein SAICODRAFT_18514 [Saitoella complicata NRRL Y-17804]
MFIPTPDHVNIESVIERATATVAKINGDYVLEKKWNLPLVALSYISSFLGAYTTTQLMCHVSSTRAPLLWLSLASLTFGGCAIWCMHFVSMLAVDVGVELTYDFWLTLVSALLAISSTFVTFGLEGIIELWNKNVEKRRASGPSAGEYQPLNTMADGVEREAQANSHGIQLEDFPTATTTAPMSLPTTPQRKSTREHRRTSSRPTLTHIQSAPSDGSVRPPSAGATTLKATAAQSEEAHFDRNLWTRRAFSLVSTPRSSTDSDIAHARMFTSGQKTMFSHREHEVRGLILQMPLSPIEDDDDYEFFRRAQTAQERKGSSASTVSTAHAYFDGTRVLTPSTSTFRIHEPWWKQIKQIKHTVWDSLTPRLIVKGILMGFTISGMHYTGMRAMRMEGYIIWSYPIVAASICVACVVCAVAVVWMPYEGDVGTQLIFSAVAASGVSAMHYVGMAAATFVTDLPEDQRDTGDLKTLLPFSVVTVCMITCFASYILLSYSLIQSRNKLAEMILTKRRLWKVLAEKEAAEHANRVKTEFISIASHEIRTPLHAISGYVDLLGHTVLNQEQIEYIDRIKAGSHAMRIITSNVLDFTKLERGNEETVAKPANIDIRTLTVNVIKGCTSPLTSNSASADVSKPVVNVDLILFLDETLVRLPETMFVDEVYLTRVLMNLVSNGLKFTTNGYVLVQVSLDPIADHDKPILQLTVRDTGAGIPRAFVSTVFEPFRQVDTTLTSGAGVGLGLAICKQLVGKMDGTIHMESTEGVGTEFIVRIPAGHRAQRGDKVNLRKGIKVAIFCGNVKKRDLLNDMLTSSGCDVTVDIDPTKESLVGRLLMMDRIYMDSESILAHQALLNACTQLRSKPIFVACHDTHVGNFSVIQLAQQAEKVHLARRPLMVHEFLRWMQEPEGQTKEVYVAMSASEGLVGGTVCVNGDVMVVTPQDASPQSSMIMSGVERVQPDSQDANLTTSRSEDATESVKPKKTALAEKKTTILLVEDNKVNQQLGLRLLNKMAFGAELAEDGQVALNLITENPSAYDLVLMDSQMPVMDGIEATRRIRELEVATGRRRLPIIALTANVSQESRNETKAAGCDDFLPKPLTIAVLKAMIEKHVEK